MPQSRESRVRDCAVMMAYLVPPRSASDPSPGPRRLVKASAAVHPLPLGEGNSQLETYTQFDGGASDDVK